jgi:hypothetical protein
VGGSIISDYGSTSSQDCGPGKTPASDPRAFERDPFDELDSRKPDAWLHALCPYTKPIVVRPEATQDAAQQISWRGFHKQIWMRRFRLTGATMVEYRWEVAKTRHVFELLKRVLNQEYKATNDLAAGRMARETAFKPA